MSSPWLRLYKVVGEIPGQSDLISVVITAPAPTSRLTHHSQPRPGQAVIIDIYLTGQVQCGAHSQLQEPGHVLAGACWLTVDLEIVEMYAVSTFLETYKPSASRICSNHLDRGLMSVTEKKTC